MKPQNDLADARRSIQANWSAYAWLIVIFAAIALSNQRRSDSSSCKRKAAQTLGGCPAIDVKILPFSAVGLLLRMCRPTVRLLSISRRQCT